MSILQSHAQHRGGYSLIYSTSWGIFGTNDELCPAVPKLLPATEPGNLKVIIYLFTVV